jgi:hypothetical protein
MKSIGEILEQRQRKIICRQRIRFAEYFRVAWFSDRVVYETAEEVIVFKALKVTEEKVKIINMRKI